MSVGACMQALRWIVDIFPSGWIAVILKTKQPIRFFLLISLNLLLLTE